MTFETLRDNILTILETDAAGRYDTHGGLVQKKGAGENILTPRVSVYYQTGNFPRSSSAMTSQTIHEANYRIEITVFVQHEADLSILNDPDATAAQRAAALQQLNNPDLALQADRLLDATFAAVYQVLMDARNYDMNLTEGDIADRWVDQFQKDSPGSFGEYLALSGNAAMGVKLVEQILGETGVPGVEVDNVINIDGDQGGNLGVGVQL